jgi:hypothetical protein
MPPMPRREIAPEEFGDGLAAERTGFELGVDLRLAVDAEEGHGVQIR